MAEPKVEGISAGSSGDGPARLVGWRLGFLTTALCAAVFLSSLDLTIVSTALVAIADDLGSFEQSSWIVSSYLVSYFSFLIIWAKLSDIFGRKFMLLLGLVFFLAFSGASGGAASTVQLIIFRALQGIGGAGMFSVVPVIVAEMVPPQSYATYNGIVSLTIALAFLVGPLVGGAIPDHTTWKWIFWINLPIGFASLCLILLIMPASFPDINTSGSVLFSHNNNKSLKNIDFTGFFLMLVASVLLIVAIEEAGISFAWDSALVLTFLVLAFVLFCLFFAWQRYLSISESIQESIVPWSFLRNRVLMGLYLNALLSGVLLVTVVIELPQRFQSVGFSSALDAGIRILPYTLTVALGSIATRVLTAKKRLPPIYVLVVSTALQIMGIGLLYSVVGSPSTPPSMYGYEVLAGLGVGLSLTTLLNVARFVVERRHLAVAVGGVTQLRILGGAIGVAIATNLLNASIRSSLASVLSSDTISNVLENMSLVSSLSQEDRKQIQSAFLKGYQKQFAMMLGFCAAEVLALALMWEVPARRIP
ncbi:hypothetical protein MMC10_009910 [Thelotrema lepadinum]|nr:hypothetical protein [Thelotrema lepadinum]